MAGNLKELDDAGFAAAVGKGLVLVDFWAPWCGPCRAQTPILEKVAGMAAGKAVVAKLNVEEQPTAAAKYNVMSIPTLILFRDGAETARFVGVQTEAKLLEALGVK